MSQFLNAIPTLDGTNFLVLNQQILSYISSQGLSKKRKLAHRDEDEVVSLDWSGSDQKAEMMEDAQMMLEEVGMEDPQTATEAGLFVRYAPNKDSEKKSDLTPTAINVV